MSSHPYSRDFMSLSFILCTLYYIQRVSVFILLTVVLIILRRVICVHSPYILCHLKVDIITYVVSKYRVQWTTNDVLHHLFMSTAPCVIIIYPCLLYVM